MATFRAPTIKSTGTPKYSPPKLPKSVPMGLGGRLKMPGAPSITAPAAATAPPPAATAAPDSGPAALPPDATYEQIIGALQRKRDTTISGLAGQRTTGLLNYGYTEDAAGKLAYDPNNPESQAAQLKKHYDQSRAGTGVRMAAAGQQYAGSYQNAQDTLNKGQLTDEDKLSKALQAFLSGNTQARTTAQTDYEFGAGQAYGDRVARVPQNPLYSPTTPDAPAPQQNPLIPGQPLSTGFAGLDPTKRYRQASNGRLQIQNSNGTWRYA